MTYSPINVQAYVSAYAGTLAGMAVSGWIVSPTAGSYEQVAAIAGAFCEAFDVAWNDATELDNFEIASIQAVCLQEFSNRGPGSLSNPSFVLAATWSVPAIACAALVVEGDTYLADQGIVPVVPGGGGASSVIRATWSVSPTVSAITFAPGSGPTYNVVAEPGTFAGLNQGDTLFISPEQALTGFFHSGTPAPELGGVWDVFLKSDDQDLTLQRNAAMSTTAQIAALAFVAVDGGSGLGVYQVVTPPAAVINVDPQVVPQITIPVHPSDGNTYFLTSQSGIYKWQLVPAASLSELITVATPALVAGVMGYVNVDLSLSTLAPLATNTPLIASPQADLVPGGATNGFYIGLRVSAVNTARLQFVGTLPGGGVSFLFTKLGN